jgi:site-specific DNA-methyltransferase (adenine-specific)
VAKIELFNEDCMEGMKRYPDKYFELAICDPPYGLGKRIVDGGSVSPFIKSQNQTVKNWDNCPTQYFFNELFRISLHQIIWGGNYYDLPPFRCYVIWDKMIHGNTYSDCELAWTSFDTPSRIWVKNIVDVTLDGRIHPTQKPVKLYEWLLKNYAKSGDKILDTHLGSGSIAIACYNLDFSLTGFEIDKDYFEGAVNRLEEHKKQGRLFDTNRRDL